MMTFGPPEGMRWFIYPLLAVMALPVAYGKTSNHFTIDSDRQYLLPNGDMKATGHVRMTSGDMVIEAEEAIYYRENPANSYVTVTGNPVRYQGTTDNGKPFTGHSLHLRYTPDTGIVILTDDVFMQQGLNTIHAERAVHNVRTSKTTASSSKGKRVRSVIYDGKQNTQKK